jgi:NADH-quinone oxidoreductase subunit C
MSQLPEELKASLQPYVLETGTYAGEVSVEVDAKSIYPVLKILKEKFGFNYLCDITATDMFTEENRFRVSYNVVNLDTKARVRVSCRVSESKPELDSVITIWPSANWYEREAYDMMGIIFSNHPDLRRMYMPEDFEYFPLRKEFPLLGIPGSIQVPEKDPPKTYR